MSIKDKFLTTVMLVSISMVTAIGQTTYKLLPASTIQVSGTSTLSDWTVRSQDLSGEMILSPSSGKDVAVRSNVVSANAGLEVATIKSEKGETMDNKMYAALKYEDHPLITFSLTKPVAITKESGILKATGDVLLAGVKRAMTFDLKFNGMGADSFHFQGSASMKLSDFSIEPPTAMFGQIETGDEIIIHLDLFFGK